MTRYLAIFVVLQAAALILVWLIRAPERVLYLFVVLLLVPLGLGLAHGQVLEASYLVIPGATVLYLVDRAVRRSDPGPRRSGRTGILLLALLFFAVVFANFFRRPIVPAGLGDLGRTPAGIHAWMTYGLSLCYFLVFAGVSFTSPARMERVLKFAGWLCLLLCLFGFVVVVSPQVRDRLSDLTARGFVHHSFFMGGVEDAAKSRFVDEHGQYRVGTLDVAAALLLIIGLTFLRSVAARAALLAFCLAALLLGGGRSILVGTVAGIVAWSFVTQKPRITLALVLVLIAGVVGVVGMVDDPPPIFRRATTLITGRALATEPRTVLFAHYAKSIEEHPIEGVGFGEYRELSGDNFWAGFLRNNLRHGGHGAYISVLYLFGLIAFIPFVALLGLGIHSSYRAAVGSSSSTIRNVALFCLLFLVYRLLPMAAEGKGGEPALHAVLGIAGGLAARYDSG